MSDIGDFRKSKDKYFGGDQSSPLTSEQRQRFSGLQYFPENPALQFVLSVEEFSKDAKEVIQMATSSGETATHLRWGQLKFEVDGTPVVLTVYRGLDSDEYFLPFMDATTGDESYAAGRYLDILADGNGCLLVDFNYAYNSNWDCRHNRGCRRS